MKYKITGRLYGEIATFHSWDHDKRYPMFKVVSEKTWEIYADTMKEVKRWLAINYPEYYMGCNIKMIGYDNFFMAAAPCSEYGAGNYETLENRINWVKANER